MLFARHSRLSQAPSFIKCGTGSFRVLNNETIAQPLMGFTLTKRGRNLQKVNFQVFIVFEIVLFFYRWRFLIPWNQIRGVPNLF